MATFCFPFYFVMFTVLSTLHNVAYLAKKMTEISQLGECLTARNHRGVKSLGSKSLNVSSILNNWFSLL